MPFLALVWLRDDAEVHEFLEEEGTGRTVGVYRFPKRDVKLCRGFSGGCKQDGWTRHKWGHWVHACHLRNRQWWKQLSIGLIDRFGINLLPREDTPKIFQNPLDWQGPMDLGSFGDHPDFSTKKRPHSAAE